MILKEEIEGCHNLCTHKENNMIRKNYLALSVDIISTYNDKNKQKIQNSLRKIQTEKLDLNPVYT